MKPFFQAKDRVENYYSNDDRMFQLDYFNGPTAKSDAERWAAANNGRIVQTSNSIWRVDKPIE